MDEAWPVPLRNRRVLLVDDESMVLMLMEDMLLDLGASTVETAMTLSEATRVAASSQFDVAVLDVNLSGERSYPVAEMLLARGIPFLFATAYGSKAHDGAWREVLTLAKPFTPRDLATALARILPSAP